MIIHSKIDNEIDSKIETGVENLDTLCPGKLN